MAETKTLRLYHFSTGIPPIRPNDCSDLIGDLSVNRNYLEVVRCDGADVIPVFHYVPAGVSISFYPGRVHLVSGSKDAINKTTRSLKRLASNKGLILEEIPTN